MDPISEQIRAFITPKFEKKSFKLKFHYNEIDYETIFIVKHTDIEIELKNNCVDVSYNYESKFFNGYIEADSETKKCFNPILITNARNKAGKRTTAADVLLIFNTKLGLTLPFEIPITLFDGAQKDNIMIAPFNILRGGDAFYEKYGYKSDIINHIKEQIKLFQWKDLTDEQKTIISKVTHTNYDDNEFLVDIMKTISWNREKEYLQENEDNKLSYRVLRLFAPKFGLTIEDMSQYSIHSIWKFTLDETDPRWIESNSSLIFTGFEVI